MKALMVFAFMLVVSVTMRAAASEDEALKQLVPTGKLRIGVAYAPAPTPVFVVKALAGRFAAFPVILAWHLRKPSACPLS
jgi:Iap family predicted aminopeptidase